MFKEGSEVKVTFKQDYNCIGGLYKELRKLVRRRKSGDVPLAETVCWQALHQCSAFCCTYFAKKISYTGMKTVGHDRPG